MQNLPVSLTWRSYLVLNLLISFHFSPMIHVVKSQLWKWVIVCVVFWAVFNSYSEFYKNWSMVLWFYCYVQTTQLRARPKSSAFCDDPYQYWIAVEGEKTGEHMVLAGISWPSRWSSEWQGKNPPCPTRGANLCGSIWWAGSFHWLLLGSRPRVLARQLAAPLLSCCSPFLCPANVWYHNLLPREKE